MNNGLWSCGFWSGWCWGALLYYVAVSLALNGWVHGSHATQSGTRREWHSPVFGPTKSFDPVLLAFIRLGPEPLLQPLPLPEPTPDGAFPNGVPQLAPVWPAVRDNRTRLFSVGVEWDFMRRQRERDIDANPSYSSSGPLQRPSINHLMEGN